MPPPNVSGIDGGRASRLRSPETRRRFQYRWAALAIVCFSLVSLWSFGRYYTPVEEWEVHIPPVFSPVSDPPQPPINTSTPAEIWGKRKNAVREAYIHAMKGYKDNAFPDDELLAVSGGSSNKFNGWGVTLVDSLDTMWIMGLKEEFADAMSFIANLRFKAGHKFIPFFETVIRYLGGLLSAYALSGEPILLARADDLGRLLLPTFNGSSAGFPAYSLNPETGMVAHGWLGNVVLFAEIASCQLEYKYLAKLTGRSEYYTSAENVMEVLYAANVTDGLFVDKWTGHGNPFGTHTSVGSSADSGYEYFLKQYLLTGDTRARDQYLISIDGIIKNLMYITAKRHLLYVTDYQSGVPTHRFEHLSCFLAGVLALGAETLDLPPDVKELHQWAAHGLTYTCYVSYADQETGLGPDGMTMVPTESKWVDHIREWEEGGRVGKPPGLEESPPQKTSADRDYYSQSNAYLLRPEAVESIYIMWKTTGDERWRERGYEIFEAIETYSRTPYGYASVSSIDYPPYTQYDDMPSYFVAETLKYLYLLFDDSDFISLDKWVFNTEAHPLPVFSWSSWEKEAYNITSPTPTSVF